MDKYNFKLIKCDNFRNASSMFHGMDYKDSDENHVETAKKADIVIATVGDKCRRCRWR